MEVQDQHMAEWLQLLNCPVQLSHKQLQKLNTPNMRSNWMHLERHVLPVQSVEIIRKNLLLTKLKSGKFNTISGKFNQFKIESVQGLYQLQNISDKQEEIKVAKDRVKHIEAMLQSATYALLRKVSEKECLKHKVLEAREKTKFLKQKYVSVQRHVDILDEEMDTASCLNICQTPLSYSELNRRKSVLTKKITQCKFSVFGTTDIDNKYIVDLIEHTLGFPATAIYDGILHACSHAIKSLNSYLAHTDVLADVSGITENLASYGVFPTSEHLRNLHSVIFQTELDLNSCLKDVRTQSIDLEKEKALLVEVISKIYAEKQNPINNSESDESMVTFVGTLVESTVLFNKIQKLREMRDELESSSSDFDCLSIVVDDLKVNENLLHEEVDKRVDHFNNLFSLICSGEVNVFKTEVYQTSAKEVYDFINKLKFDNKDSKTLLATFENMSEKEIQIFQKISLSALSRKWDTWPKLMLSSDVLEGISRSSSLSYILLHSEVKNIFKNLIEKIV